MFHENNEVMEYFTLEADTRMSHGSSVFFFFFLQLTLARARKSVYPPVTLSRVALSAESRVIIAIV